MVISTAVVTKFGKPLLKGALKCVELALLTSIGTRIIAHARKAGVRIESGASTAYKNVKSMITGKKSFNPLKLLS